MLQDELTHVKYDYYPHNLSRGSNKKFVVRCDYCQGIYETTHKIRNKFINILDKDGCKKCKYKKREEISLIKDGVKNSAQRKDVKDKVKDMNQKKYGVDSFTQTAEFKQKSEKTMIKRYGVKNAMQNKQLQDKQKQTVLEKYGVENVSQLDSTKEKVKETCLERFGEEHYFNSDDIKEKTVAKLGVDNPFKLEEIQQRVRQTNLDKYGVKFPMQNKEILQKSKETVRKKYGVENIMQNKSSQEKVIQTKIIKKQIMIHQGKTMPQWSQELEQSYDLFRYRVNKFGFEQAIKMPKYSNGLEEILAIWLKSVDIKYQRQYRVKNRIADFYLPEVNLLIEADGVFWHCDKIIEDNNYHFNKKKLYVDEGYNSMFFRENEINRQFDIVKSIVLNKLGKNKAINAKDCKFLSYNKKGGKKFLDVNHLASKSAGEIYALTYEDEVVACAQIKRIKGNDYEIVRLCYKLGFNVIGAFAKLISNIDDIIKPDSITVFVDLRYESGIYLQDLGFSEVRCTPSFKWVRGDKTFHRTKMKGNSGYEYGFAKIWDCGQAKYIKS